MARRRRRTRNNISRINIKDRESYNLYNPYEHRILKLTDPLSYKRNRLITKQPVTQTQPAKLQKTYNPLIKERSPKKLVSCQKQRERNRRAYFAFKKLMPHAGSNPFHNKRFTKKPCRGK